MSFCQIEPLSAVNRADFVAAVLAIPATAESFAALAVVHAAVAAGGAGDLRRRRRCGHRLFDAFTAIEQPVAAIMSRSAPESHRLAGSRRAGARSGIAEAVGEVRAFAAVEPAAAAIVGPAAGEFEVRTGCRDAVFDNRCLNFRA